jgi:hypothetical protein
MSETSHSNIPVLTLIVAFIITFSVATIKGLTRKNILIAFMAASGLSFIMGGMGHIFSPNIVAEGIGWPASPRFQFEVGIANLMVAILCLGTIYFNDDWILASIVAMIIWGFGNTIGHMISLYNDNNRQPGNVGWVTYVGVVMPIIAVILYILYKNKKN